MDEEIKIPETKEEINDFLKKYNLEHEKDTSCQWLVLILILFALGCGTKPTDDADKNLIE